jgi:hypothetical protein
MNGERATAAGALEEDGSRATEVMNTGFYRGFLGNRATLTAARLRPD